MAVGLAVVGDGGSGTRGKREDGWLVGDRGEEGGGVGGRAR